MKKLSRSRRNRHKAKPYLMKDQNIASQKGKVQIDERKRREARKRRNSTIDALGFFVMSIAIGYAPEYIGTKNTFVVNIGKWGSFLFLMIGMLIIHHIYSGVLLSDNAAMIFMFTIGIFFYWITIDPSVAHKIPLSTIHSFRFMSLLGLLCTILMLISKLPRLLDSYESNKGNIKVLFKVKNIPGLILGILTMGTALFQFLQVLLSFIHH